MVADVLARLGFDAELTPGSKDGGKDGIVRFDDGTGAKRSYGIKLKHWRSRKLVGSASIKDLVQVIAREGHERGLFVSTSGFTEDPFSAITEIKRRTVELAEARRVVGWCATYVKAEAGLWKPVNAAALDEIPFSP